MCGSLRLEGEDKKINALIPSRYLMAKDVRRPAYRWTGFARIDGSVLGTKTMADQWPKTDWNISLLNCRVFKERGKAFRMPQNAKMGVLLNHDTGELKVITRAAKTRKEKDVHHRWPSAAHDMTAYEYKKLVEKYGKYNT